MGGVSTNSVGNVLSRSAENFPRGILYCCSIFGYRKNLEKKRVEYQHFPSKIFCLSVPKVFAGETLCAVFQKDSSSKKFVNKRGWVSRFSVEFLSRTAKNIRR